MNIHLSKVEAMWSLNICVLVGVLSATQSVTVPGVTTTEKYQQSIIMDEDASYILFWNFNDTHITFEAHVKTRGWVGLGLSENGNMFPADVAVGWVNADGSVELHDMHTTGHRPPVLDASQDWFPVLGMENDFGTVLKIVRKIKTCDRADDKDINFGTNRVIFAYGDSDPHSPQDLHYHGTHRGTKSMFFLNPDKGESNIAPTEKVKHLDFLNGNFMVPNRTTTYWCKAFTLPPIGKHHMIKYEPVISPGNEKHVHHILLSRCRKPNPEQYHGMSENCYTGNMTLPQCNDYIVAWAIGGTEFYFPDGVGYSMGAADDGNYYRMETHYDNPDARADILDDSGIRITITPDLRALEAGMFAMGLGTNIRQVIPPGETDFVSYGHCHGNCTTLAMNQVGVPEIKIFGALQHSHLVGVAITTHHYRNGMELPHLIDDPNYDFNFQDLRKLPQEVSVYPGDSFRVDCHYNTMGKTQPVLGGLTTQEEMCLTFAYYYPKTPLSNCMSISIYRPQGVSKDWILQQIATADWSNKTVVDWFRTQQTSGLQWKFCGGEYLNLPADFAKFWTPNYPSKSYTPPQPDCS
ncbi:DBH-like monooxygenase protein 1 homolog [Mya arenaria]|uniref:DBH-like monooxygenase protein 1 homolog n=1 Tax=Mya arenaria TaxID=6604 RepID=UPI0022E316B0|nr:DBH-like monooxygenase protein 1 homolog [Mya arenaria]